MKISIPVNFEINCDKDENGSLFITKITASTSDQDVDQNLLDDITNMIENSDYIQDIEDIVYTKTEISKFLK
jgi:hypothetical protein